MTGTATISTSKRLDNIKRRRFSAMHICDKCSRHVLLVHCDLPCSQTAVGVEVAEDRLQIHVTACVVAALRGRGGQAAGPPGLWSA